MLSSGESVGIKQPTKEKGNLQSYWIKKTYRVVLDQGNLQSYWTKGTYRVVLDKGNLQSYWTKSKSIF
jgi:hypothetical protein